LSVHDADVHITRPLSLEGAMRVRLDSALPALEALTGRGRLPPLLGSVVASQPLDAKANVHLDREGLRARDIDATAGPVRVRGRYASTENGRDGAMLVEAGPLVLGVEVHDEKTTILTLGARQWFAEQGATDAAPPAASASRPSRQ
jgi:hypothetical protein